MYPVFKKMYHDTRRKLFLWRLLTGKYKGTVHIRNPLETGEAMNMNYKR